MKIPASIKKLPGQLAKSAKLHAKQGKDVQAFLKEFIKNGR
jgi:hypothetical protein